MAYGNHPEPKYIRPPVAPPAVLPRAAVDTRDAEIGQLRAALDLERTVNRQLALSLGQSTALVSNLTAGRAALERRYILGELVAIKTAAQAIQRALEHDVAVRP